MNSNRQLYIAAYDIACPKRLRRALMVLKGYACGRQKSVFEVWLSAEEKKRLLGEVGEIVVRQEDRFFLLKLTGHRPIHTLGIAVLPITQDYCYIA